jgi:uncharacterized OsmC-like protein
MYAANHAIPLAGTMAEESLEQQDPREAIFRYIMEYQGPLSAEQRQELARAAHDCPVHQILAGKIAFVSGTT